MNVEDIPRIKGYEISLWLTCPKKKKKKKKKQKKEKKTKPQEKNQKKPQRTILKQYH